MDKHWNNFCTMSIVHFMAFPNTMGGEGPIVETVSKIAEDPFFGAIEIGWIKDAKVRAATKAVLEAAHIKIGFGAQSALLLQKLDMNSSDEAERMKAVGQPLSFVRFHLNCSNQAFGAIELIEPQNQF